MSLSRLKEKGQITIPTSIREQIHAATGDIFDFQISDGEITMTPQRIVPATKKSIVSDKKTDKKPIDKKRDLSKWMGAATVFKSAQEVDEFIRRQRDAWD